MVFGGKTWFKKIYVDAKLTRGIFVMVDFMCQLGGGIWMRLTFN